jgi:multiple sugar transport system substrate-binding protein
MKTTRRKFLTASAALGLGMTPAYLFVGGCKSRKKKDNTIKLGVSSFSVNVYRQILESLDFTGQTNINVDVVMRPIASNELLIQMTSAVQAGTSPYDVIDLEDATAIPFAHAGWLLTLDDLIGPEIWADYTPSLMEMTKIWDQYKGQTFRIHHNFELCYWWYRKDWFETRGLTVPKTWDDVKQMGKVFTDKSKGIWATAEGMQKNSFLDVYTAWITRQAGGNLYDADDSFRLALEYIHDLMYKYQTLNPACLQKNYDQQNSDYLADRVAFMRQWPFLYDVAQEYSEWYSPEKIACHLPPVGPGGMATSTYAAGWGYGIPRTAPNAEAAKELVKFLIATENVTKMITYSTWFLNARHSVLRAAEDKDLAKYLKMYMDAGVITNRPYHPKYAEAIATLETITSAYLTNQISLDKAMQTAQKRMNAL